MSDKIFDLIIIGCGPAGLSAAINARIRNLDLLLMGSDFSSPKLYKAEKINNYLGLPEISGLELKDKFLTHLKKLEVPIQEAKVDSIYPADDHYIIMARNKTYRSYKIILAPGISTAKLIQGEEDLVGSGVSYCATCDGPLYKGKNVAVVAYNPEGIEDAKFLAEITNQVYLIPQFELEAEANLPEISVIQEKPTAINLPDNSPVVELENQQLEVDGVFIYRDTTPADKLIYGLELNDNHIKVDHKLETNFAGIYAAGDCTGIPYQVAKAVAEGQLAALNAASQIRKEKNKLS